MANLRETITKDIAEAMKQKDQARLVPLRMLKAALMNRENEKARDLDEAESLQVVAQLIKQRRESIEQFRSGGRDELAAREEAEIKILERYQPPAADAAAIERAIGEAIVATGASGMKDMGKVMKAASALLAGQSVDGRVLSESVKKRLVG